MGVANSSNIDSLEEIIFKKIKNLTKTSQAEVLDFVDYLSSKKDSMDDQSWNEMSLNNALKDMEDDPIEYTAKDIKEAFTS